MSSAESYLASQLERLMSLPLETEADLAKWELERNDVETTLGEKFPDFEPSDAFWHFIVDADIRRKDSGYRDHQNELVSQYICRLRGQIYDHHPSFSPMKTSPLKNILWCASSVLMLVTVFSNPLGIPTEFQGLPALLAVICLAIAIRSQKKTKEAQPPIQRTDAQQKKIFIVMMIAVALASASSPWVMPLTGVVLPFQTRIIIAILTFALCATLIWLGQRRCKTK